MPTAPPKACNHCHQTFTGRRCPCRPAWANTSHPHDDARMAKLRTAKLAANPLCEWPQCMRPATRVDHIIPLAEGGQRYEWSNLQSLCRPHDITKTAADAARGKTRLR